MLVLGVIVVLASTAMLLANRYNRMNGHSHPGAMDLLSLIGIDDQGLHCKSTSSERNDDSISPSDEVIDWSSISEVAVVNRREFVRKRFGFELLVDGGRLLFIDGSSPDGEAFLSRTHNFVGFDHSGLVDALLRRHPRTVCYSG